MKIGDRVFVRGYIDEIRKDTVIIRNTGGYFGTIPSEVITGELPSAQLQLEECPIYGGMCGYPSNLCYECPRHEGAKERPQWWTAGLQPFAQPKWIPVTEMLPERGKDVLVTRDYDGRADHIKSCRYVEVASCYGEDDDVSWNSYSDEYKMTPKNHRVVAWMPLPEAYKGEEE